MNIMESEPGGARSRLLTALTAQAVWDRDLRSPPNTGAAMASKKYGTKPPEWWKHLRWQKRPFWKKSRGQAKRDIRQHGR